MALKDYAKKHSERLLNWKNNVSKFTNPFESTLGTNDVWAILFICCVSLFVPKLLWAVPLYVLLKTNRRVVSLKDKRSLEAEDPIISLIQKNYLQTLTEAIESNPEILYTLYKKQPLSYWCRFYNNHKALMVVTQMTKKHPKEKAPIAA